MTRFNQKRSFGICAHVDAGKTSLTEQILLLTGKTHKLGLVHQGNTVMDSDSQEKERGITIKSAATSFEWDGHQMTLIDTPGHSDFSVEVERALRVLDGAVLLVDAVAGVQAQTEAVFRQARRYGLPTILVVNKMDRPGADFDAALASVEKKLGIATIKVAHAVGSESEFSGLRMRTLEEMAEELAMLDETLLDDFDNRTDATIEAALRRAVGSGQVLAAIPASAKSGIGIEATLDLVVRCLPSPVAMEVDETVAYCFKQTVDPTFGGTLSWLRVYAGELEAGQQLKVDKDKVRLGQLDRLHADKRERIQKATVGDIIAVTGLDTLATGTTLSESGQVTLEGIHTTEPLVRVAVESSDRDRLGSALHTIVKEDPSLASWVDAESGQTILAGVGELQIEVVLERIRREYKIDVRSGAPMVAYRATLARSVEVTGRNISQTGGSGQFAVVRIKAEPTELGSGIVIEDATVGGSIGREFMRGVFKGIEDACESSTMDGWPLVDCTITVLDGKTHAVDSSEMAFRIAGKLAMEEAQENAGLTRLEPMVVVDMDLPQDHVGAVTGEIQRRGGVIQAIEGERVVGRMPLASCFGWMTALKSLTQGRGASSIVPDGYQVAH